jgi:hypothetical protein
MKPWWGIDTGEPLPPVARAVAYYRHSAQGRQENSIPIQHDQVRQRAAESGVEIVHEFCDHGKSGLTAGPDGRRPPGLYRHDGELGQNQEGGVCVHPLS